MSSRLQTLRPDNDDLVDAGFLVVLGGLALSSFHASFGGVLFMVPAMFALLVGMAVAHAARRLRLDPLLTTAIVFVAYVLLVGTVALRDQATAGFLPSLDTMRGAVESIVTGWKRLLTTAPPVGNRAGLFIVPAICGVVAGAVGLSAARRSTSAWLALLPVYATLALGLLCGPKRPVSVLLHGVVLTVVVIVWMAVRRQRLRPVLHHAARQRRMLSAAGMLLVVGLASLTVGPHLPMVQASDRVVWRNELNPPFDPSQYPSPLNGYRRYLKQLKEKTLFTISGLPAGVPVRLATMDVYDGLVWRVAGATHGTSGLFERVGDDVGSDFPGQRATIHITIGEGFPADSVWVPTVGEVRSITFGGPRAQQLTDDYRYNHTTDTGVVPLGFRPGDEYTMVVTLPTLAAVLADQPDPEVIPQLAADVLTIPSVTSFGADIADVSQETNQIRKAELLASYLSNGFYNDPAKTGSSLPSGHGQARLENFVKGKVLVGDAEQYAATAGVIAAIYKIPARVVMGFQFPAGTGDGPVNVLGSEAEAWMEVPVKGLGWVGLNTTPPRTREQQQVEQQQSKVPDRQTQVPPPPAIIVADAPVDPASSSGGKRERTKEQRDALSPDAGGVPVALVAAGIAAVPLVLAGGASGTIFGLKRRRQRRRRLTGSPNQRIANGWSELVDNFRDMGRPVPRVATRGEVAAFSGAAVIGLAMRADAAVFGPGEPSDDAVDAYWADVQRAMNDARASMKWTDRWKSRLSLTSLTMKER